jgi:hypothetical protein
MNAKNQVRSGTVVETSESESPDICVQKCKKFACELQYCLERYNHQEERCVTLIKAWKDCCEDVKSTLGTGNG